MKSPAILAVLSAIAIILAIHFSTGSRLFKNGGIDEPPRPQVFQKSYALLPTQSLEIENGHFRRIEIRSQFPIRALTGSCQANYTVDFFCNDEPHDILITDARNMPVFSTPTANPITFIAREF